MEWKLLCGVLLIVALAPTRSISNKVSPYPIIVIVKLDTCCAD